MTNIINETINNYISEHIVEYQNIAKEIHEKPEVSNYEFFACETLSNKLKESGFTVQTNVAGHRTGFDARYKSNKSGPVVVFLAEFDALVGIGHACGHNLFGATSLLAACALKEIINEIGGEIRVYGTPGEEGGENGSAKGSFVREGFFDDVDFALCVHPAYKHGLSSTSLANDPVDVEFFGKAAHAAAEPEKGINALDAILQVYNSVNALRQHLSDDVRIHGVITHGGDAANIVPDYASARFFLRAQKRSTLKTVYEKFENIVKASALATGTTYKFGLFQNSVDNMVCTPSFDQVYLKNLKDSGQDISLESSSVAGGSTDVGNVSQVVPTIQPTISISDHPIIGHSLEFREAAISDKGLKSIALGAKLMALTAKDIIESKELLKSIKKEHKQKLREQEA